MYLATPVMKKPSYVDQFTAFLLRVTVCGEEN